MMSRSRQNHQARAKSGFLLLSLNKISSFFLALLVLFLPTQFGKHFWPDYSVVSGIRVDYLSPTLYITDVIVIILFFFFLVQELVIKNTATFFKKTKVFVLVLAYFFVTTLFSKHVSEGLYCFLRLLEFSFVAFYLSKHIKSLHDITKAGIFLAIGTVFESVLAFTQYINQGSVGGLLYFLGERTFTSSTPGIANAAINGQLILRPYSTFPHPNVLAGFLLISMVLILFLLSYQQKRFIKIIFLLGLLFGTVAIFLSLSRVAILLWLIILSIAIWAFLKKAIQDRARAKNIFIAVSILVILTICLVVFPLYPRFAQTTLGEESIVQRQILISDSLEMIRAHPVIGVGLGNFIPSLVIFQKFISLGFYLQPVHNIFLLTAAETGLIGLAILVWFLVMTYKRLLCRVTEKHYEKNVYRVFLFMLTIVIITGLFDHYWLTLQQGQLLFSLVLGLSWSSILNNAISVKTKASK